MKKYIAEIEKERKEKNMSIKQLCKLADVKILNYLRFVHRKGISCENLNKLRDVLGILDVEDEIIMKIKTFKQ